MASEVPWLVPFVLWTLLFSLFLVLLLLPRRRTDWRSAGIYEAFLLALFAEMFGFPLTVFALSAVLGLPGPVGAPDHPVAHFLGAGWSMGVLLGAALVLVVVGAALVVVGWRGIYRGGDRLVTTGIYARVRHPQYLGLILLTSGLLVWWPTVLTVPMWPLLAWTYVRLARKEEAEVTAHHPEYELYRQSVPGFLPRPARRR